MGTARAQTDVIVLGGGAAGLTAALEASNRGASVTLLEAADEVGGSTRLSGAYVALCETPLQPGSKDELFADLVDSHHGDADEQLSRAYVDDAPAMHDVLAKLGLHFEGTSQFPHMRRPWAHHFSVAAGPGGANLVDGLLAAATERGVRVVTGARARRLTRDAHGRVTGVVGDGVPDGRMDAGSGVVVASGGFTRNPELVKQFGSRPGSEKIVPMTGARSNGDGLLMACAVGAGLSYMGLGIAPSGPVSPSTGKGFLIYHSGGVVLNLRGERFIDESRSYVDVAWAALEQPEVAMIQVYDQNMKELYGGTMIGQALTGGQEVSAPTLDALVESLADLSGLDAGTARSTLDTYNDDVLRLGHDSVLGRRHVMGATGQLVPIAQGPFHAMHTVPGTSHFNGGLRVDPGMKVLDVFGDPIEGLYAAGEVTGGFHGAGYLSASHVGAALIFGRRAGASAAQV